MNREEARTRAEKLVEQMTVEEMASQLRFDAPAIERIGVPEYNWWNEGLHGLARGGTATVFPQAIGLGATFDTELLYDVGECVSIEARAKYNAFSKLEDRDIYKGLTIWSPNVNLVRDPRWGRGQETYGEDPVLISKLAVPFIKGLQGEGEYLRTAACAKHFAVHSGPEADRHYFDAKADRKDMWESYLPAFEACVKEAGVESVMGAYNRTNGEPCCAHEYLMENVLRGQWNFEGHYVSDCWAVRDFHENHKVTEKPEDSVTLALARGCDLNCGCTYQRIMNAYEEGKLPLEYIKRSAVHVFTTRYLLGMFDQTEYDQIPYEVVDSKTSQELNEKASRESVVLLKNDGILPLTKEKISTIAVIGPNADSRAALVGNYHGTAARYITVLEGIQDIVKNDVRVLYAKGAHLYQDREEPLAKANDRIAEAVITAKHSDVVILCLGLDETLEGEEGDTGNAYASGDKFSLDFPKSQLHLLDAIIATKKPLIVCSMTGSAINLSKVDVYASAVLQTWYPGARGGKVLAEILFGKEQPSGKLPVTFYKNLKDMPDFKDYSMKGRTYRYLEKAPLYPFGYGLTYGEAKLTECKLEIKTTYADAIKQDVSVLVNVVNCGDREVEEVLQVYVRVNGSEYEVRNSKLVAFQRISLKLEKSIDLRITIPRKSFGVVNDLGETVYDGTGADIYVGFGQPDSRTKELRMKDEWFQIAVQ